MYARCVVGVIMDGVEVTAREEAAKVPGESDKMPALVSDVVQLGTECGHAIVEDSTIASRETHVELQFEGERGSVLHAPLEKRD